MRLGLLPPSNVGADDGVDGRVLKSRAGIKNDVVMVHIVKRDVLSDKSLPRALISHFLSFADISLIASVAGFANPTRNFPLLPCSRVTSTKTLSISQAPFR